MAIDEDNIPTNGSDWSHWSKLIISEIKQLNRSVEKLNQEIKKNRDSVFDEIKEVREETQNIYRKLSVEISTLKVKSGIFGILAGSIPVAVFLLFKLLG